MTTAVTLARSSIGGDKIRNRDDQMFKVGDRVAVIHLDRMGRETRSEAIRVDTIEKVTPKQIVTNKAKFNAESGFQVGRLAPEYQVVPLTPEHEKEIKAREELAEQQAAERQAILQKRESLHRLFPEKYAPDVSVFTDGLVEIMFKLSYEQAENLARLMRRHDL